MRLILACGLFLCAFAAPAAGARGHAHAHALAVPLLAHDVSRPVGQAVARTRPHTTPRHAEIAAAFPTALTRLLPQRAHVFNSAARSLAPVSVATWDGAAYTGSLPSDANGDIGLTQYAQVVNGKLSVYSRAAPHSLLAAETNAQFWAGLSGPDAAGLCASSPGGDPTVVYDRAADRWVYSEFAFAVDGGGTPLSPYVQCVAVSTTPDATGTWYRYAFQVSTTKFPDYPKLGVWRDGYYLSYNQFDAGGTTFQGAGALALERSAMLTGSAAQARYFDLESVNPGLGGMLPATIESPTLPAAGDPELYLQSEDDPNNAIDRLEVWAFHVDWTAPVTGSTFQPAQPVNYLPVNTFRSTFDCGASCIHQPALGSPTLDQISDVVDNGTTVVPQLMYHVQYFRDAGGNEHLVATQTVNAGSDQAAVRWYELANTGSGWAVSHQGTYSPDATDNRWLASAGYDNSGDVLMAFNASSATNHPSLRWTGRLQGDPNGTMSIAEQTILAGSQSQPASNRWGDYSSLSLDPLDGCTFWSTGQYSNGSSGWGTKIAELRLSTCTVNATQRPVLTADATWSTPIVREGQTITATAATVTGATTTTYQWRRCDSHGFACVDIAGQTGLTHLFTAADAAGDRTVRFQETDTNAQGTSVSVSVATPVVQSLPPVNVTLPVISGTAQSGSTLSTTNGTWTSSSPITYTYRWRRCTTTCVFIAGATSSTYVPTVSDVGSTLDVIVSATNTGGGTDANAAATAAVTAAPAAPSGGSGGSGGGSGGGGGGGGAGSPDLKVTGTASAASASVGDQVLFLLTVTDANLKPAQSLYVNVALPAGLQYVSSTADRGSACTPSGSGSLRCFLDWLSGDATTASLQILTVLKATGPQTLTAVASSQQGVLTAANSTLSLTLNASTSSGSTASAAPAGLNGGTTTTTTTKTVDRKKPTARAIASTGLRGKAAKLRFRIYDDRGSAKAMVTVKRGGKVVGRAGTGFGPVAYGSTYYVGWQVPRRAAKGTYTFCVVAYDHASNSSPSSCAALSVR